MKLTSVMADLSWELHLGNLELPPEEILISLQHKVVALHQLYVPQKSRKGLVGNLFPLTFAVASAK